ncbi:MAG: DNA glycosylase AlkZ-like family protein, partial [Candidatus Limnocylindria bacterium]
TSPPTNTLRLLAGFDQWVLGPGTDDVHVLPAARRSAVSRQSGWIAPAVVVGGVVCGTWKLDGDRVEVQWFGEAGRIPRRDLANEVARLSSILARDLGMEVSVT